MITRYFYHSLGSQDPKHFFLTWAEQSCDWRTDGKSTFCSCWKSLWEIAAGPTFPQPLWSWLQNRNMTSTICHFTPAHYISMGDFECLASETVHCGSDSQQQQTHYRGLRLSKNTGAKGEQHKMQQGDRDQTCPLSGKTFLQVRGLNSNSAQLEGPKIFLCFQQGL